MNHSEAKNQVAIFQKNRQSNFKETHDLCEDMISWEWKVKENAVTISEKQVIKILIKAECST